MRASKFLSAFLSTVYTFQTLAAPAIGKADGSLESARTLVVALTINSSVPAGRALDAILGVDDRKEVQEFLKSQNVDLDQVVMSDAPYVDGLIHYGEKSAEVREDRSIKIDGHVLKYDRTQSPGQNYIRFYKAFAGKTKSDYTLKFIDSLLPQAAAQSSTGSEQTVVVTGPLTGKFGVAFLEGYGLAWVAQQAVTDIQKQRVGAALAKGIGTAGNLAKADAAVAEANAARTKILEGMQATGKNLKGRAKASVQTVVNKTQGAAARARAGVTTASEWSRGRLSALASKMPKGGGAGALRTAGAAIAAAAGATALLVAGGVVALGAGVIGGKAWYASLMNGKFECGPPDGNGQNTYIFNFTKADSAWYWKTTDQRAFTASDIKGLFNIQKNDCPSYRSDSVASSNGASSSKAGGCDPDEILGCDDDRAALLTTVVRGIGEGLIAELSSKENPAGATSDGGPVNK